MRWVINDPSRRDPDLKMGEGRSIELTLTAKETMEGAGFLGIGWRSREMKDAEIWFCTVDPDIYSSFPRPFPDSCSERQTSPAMFSCCVARGANVKPACLNQQDSVFYELSVVDWCLSKEEASVTVTTLVCDAGKEFDGSRDCFETASNPDGTIDNIVAFNPSDQSRPHGFQRRSSSVIDLNAGMLTESETGIADDGLIAYHAVTMLIFWMILAPAGIFIVRYMKTKSWRLVAHISLMGAVGYDSLLM